MMGRIQSIRLAAQLARLNTLTQEAERLMHDYELGGRDQQNALHLQEVLYDITNAAANMVDIYQIIRERNPE